MIAPESDLWIVSQKARPKSDDRKTDPRTSDAGTSPFLHYPNEISHIRQLFFQFDQLISQSEPFFSLVSNQFIKHFIIAIDNRSKAGVLFHPIVKNRNDLLFQKRYSLIKRTFMLQRKMVIWEEGIITCGLRLAHFVVFSGL